MSDAAARALGAALSRDGLWLATAESCTGGLVAQRVTAVPGSSGWFDRGFIAYSNAAKEELLGVDPTLLLAHGAVSAPVALAMASGALAASRADLAVAVTGVAGPGGGSAEKPVGTVWMAWQRAPDPGRAGRFRYSGDREAVRRQAAADALRGLLALLGEGAVPG